MNASEELRRIAQELVDLADTDLGDGSMPAPLSRTRLVQAQETMWALYELHSQSSRDHDLRDVLFTSSLLVGTCSVSSACFTAASKVSMGVPITVPFPWEPRLSPERARKGIGT